MAFDNLFLQYIQSITDVAVADPPEYEEYAKTDIKTIPTYLHFAQVGAKKLKEIIPGGGKPEVLQGYLVFETMMLDYLYDAIKKEQVR